MKKKKLYIANPYGFSKQTKNLLNELIKIFQDLNLEVYETFEWTKHLITNKNCLAYEIVKTNFEDLKICDGIFAIVNGNSPDEGVMVELGIAIALKKEIFLFRDDFRKYSDSDQYPLNLMLFVGLSKESWIKNYFETLEDINNPNKNFVNWAKSK